MAHPERFWATTLLIGIALWSQHVEALKEKGHTIDTELDIFVFQKFGMLNGGTISMNVIWEPENAVGLRMIICEQDDYRTVHHEYPSNHSDLCKSAQDIKCYINNLMVGGNYTLYQKVRHGATYYFLVSNCKKELLSMTFSYVLSNPNGEHLSSGYIPLPTVFLVFSIVWTGIVAVWIVNWIRWRQYSLHLHKLISAVPLLKLICVVYELYYWVTWSRNGEVSDVEVALYFVLILIFQLLFFGTLVLISKGWGVARFQLERREWLAVAMTVGFVAFSVIFYKLISPYYLFALIIALIVALRYIFTNSGHCLAGLKAQLTLARQQRLWEAVAVVQPKWKLLKRYQSAMVAYMFLYALTIVLIIFFLANTPWVEQLLEELLDLAAVLAVLYIFRLRNFRQLQDAEAVVARIEHETEANNTETDDSDSELGGLPLSEWRRELQMPPSHQLKELRRQGVPLVLVVQQPSIVVAGGRVVPSIAIATVYTGEAAEGDVVATTARETSAPTSTPRSTESDVEMADLPRTEHDAERQSLLQ